MEPDRTIYSEQEGPGPAPNCFKSSKSSQEDEALSKLEAKDSALGEVMKLLFGKIDETNKKLDVIQGELRRDLDLCQHQLAKLVGAEIKVPEEHIAMKMETIPMVQDKLEGNGLEVVQNCINTPTILRGILQQLPDKELIKLSLVSKLWNHEARSVLRDRGSLRAKICSRHVCRKLAQFASDLDQMRVVPFTGIHVGMDHFEDGRGTCPSAAVGPLLDISYQVILDRQRWKHLSVKFPHDWSWEDFNDCPALEFVQRVLESHCGVLEELSISLMDDETTEFSQSILQDRSFPCLKILEIHSYDDLPKAFIKALLSCAPNLERLHWNSPLMLTEISMEIRSAAVVVVDSLNPLYCQDCATLAGALRAQSIHVLSRRSIEPEILNSFVPKFLHASRTTVKTVIMDLLFAVPLMCYGICLTNVTTLALYMTDSIMETIQPHTLALTKAFDFTRVFPKLKQVKIRDFHEPRTLWDDGISAFVERGNAVLREALPDRAINITHLEFDRISFGHSTIPFLAQIFQHVTTLSVKTNAREEFSFTSLWEHFEYVEALYVNYYPGSPRVGNLDSVFCGISPEEVAELRTKDDEYLKAANIVPVMYNVKCSN